MRPEPVRLIIDTDPGIDDLVTLALAARSPEVNVVAVTTTYGNASLHATTRNARAVLEHAGRADIPVHPGSERPLSRPPVSGAAMHGSSGVGYAEVTAATSVTADPAALLRALESVAAPLTLLTLGPLTNLAHALDRDSSAVKRAVACHLAMLGAFSERGAPDRLADFNAWADPEAVHRVLQAGLPTTVVPLEVTRRMILPADHVARLAQSPDRLSRWLAGALRYSVEAHRRIRGVHGCAVNDVLTLGQILVPGLLTVEERRIEVDLDEGERRGHTRVREGGAAIQVATDVDVARMRALLTRVLVV